MALDSKLRGCDLVQLRVRDVAHGDCHAAEDPATCPIRDQGADLTFTTAGARTRHWTIRHQTMCTRAVQSSGSRHDRGHRRTIRRASAASRQTLSRGND
jgi:hypothetical protein